LRAQRATGRRVGRTLQPAPQSARLTGHNLDDLANMFFAASGRE
jgi:hypothetical protein